MEYVYISAIINSNILETLHKSFTYIGKNKGPKIASCATPQPILFGSGR